MVAAVLNGEGYPTMSVSAVPPAVAAARSIASALGLKADDAVVLHGFEPAHAAPAAL